MSTVRLDLGRTGITLRDALQRLATSAPAAAGQALRQVGEDIATTSKTLTPVDTGDLRASTFVEGPTVETPGVLTVTVSAGRGLDYAIPVHERTDVRHTVGQAKYLEAARDLEAGGEGLALKVSWYMRRALKDDGVPL